VVTEKFPGVSKRAADGFDFSERLEELNEDLSYEHTTDIFSEHFHRLRDFALDHTEAGVILQAID
jgi:hypothetical protein